MKLIVSFVVLMTLFSSCQASYQPHIAHQLAYMSAIAYESVASINAWSCHYCKSYNMQHVKAFNNAGGDLQGFTGYSSTINGIVLSFRGSSNIANWITNIATNQVTYPKCSGCKVHNGFYSAWKLAASVVHSSIQDLRQLHRGAPIFITGHSLGGALATLAAVEVKELFGSVSHMITFGEPRVGNQQFSTWYKGVVTDYRVVHNADIVPHIPPNSFGFVHQGQEVWYKKGMTSYQVCTYGESSKCSNSLIALYNTGDHSITNYLLLPKSLMHTIRNYFYFAADEVMSRVTSLQQNMENNLEINDK